MGEFPTLIFFQTGYSVFTLRQASRRSWRIGQEQPVKVYYLNYGNTMQELALSLLAAKMETALAVEGETSPTRAFWLWRSPATPCCWNWPGPWWETWATAGGLGGRLAVFPGRSLATS